jgi:RsiW-degrading membrane proteinase PrsW (M82 family)
MLIFASALAAILPMLTYLVLIWYFDFYDREPFKLVLQNYFWGAFGAIIFSIFGSLVFTALLSFIISSKEELEYLTTVIVAPVTEEVMKGLFLFLTVARKKFDNITDGIVYGGAVGLGFGMTENFLYFISFGTNLGDWLFVVIIRTLFSAVMHCISTGTFGAFLGFSKFKRLPVRLMFAFTGLAIAIFIHFIWNYTIASGSSAFYGIVFMILTIVLFVVLFISAVMSERKIIFNELKEEAENGIIPSSHVGTLSSLSRNKKGWIEEAIRKVYISSATTLAFRKMQLKNSTGKRKHYYENEVIEYRKLISYLLAPPGITPEMRNNADSSNE